MKRNTIKDKFAFYIDYNVKYSFQVFYLKERGVLYE